MDDFKLKLKLSNAYAEVARALRDLGDEKNSGIYFRKSQDVYLKAKKDKNSIESMLDQI